MIASTNLDNNHIHIGEIVTNATTRRVARARGCSQSAHWRLWRLVTDLGASSWKLLRQVRLSNLWDLFKAKYTSVNALAIDIFFKRIRAVSFNRVFDDQTFPGRLNANYVYRLCDNDGPTFFEKPDNPVETNDQFLPEIVEYPATIKRSPEVTELSRKGSQIGPDLWFTAPYKLIRGGN